MPVYRLDLNRGNDANDGIAAPWKNLSRLASFTPLTGDVIALASDSWWTVDNRIALPYNNNGTQQSPILITSYDPAGASLEKPHITFRRTLTAGDFASDADGWYFDAVVMTTAVLNWHCFVRLGGMDGLRMEAALSTMKDQKIDRSWKESGTRLYVYSPPGINPVHYYGSVEFGHSSKTFATSGYGRFLILEKIRICDGGGLFNYYTSDQVRTMICRDLESDDATVPLSFYPDAGSNFTMEVYGSKFSESQSVHIAAFSGNLTTGSLLVRDNEFVGGNRGYPQGQVYLQARLAWSRVTGNRFRGARFGTVHHQFDGCAIYSEVGADRVLVDGNVVTDTYLAFSDNSGRGTTWMGNLVVNCHSGIIVNDFSNVGAMNHRFYNNTLVNLGYPIAPQGPGVMSGIGWYMYDQPSGVERFDIRNNILTRFPGAVRTDPAIETPISTAGPATISHNCIYGFGTAAAAYNGAAVSPAVTETIPADPRLTSAYRLLPDSPCRGAGVYIPGVRHMGGMPMRMPADIGAFGYVEPREVAG